MLVGGRENIPREGPCVLTVNHYDRRGFDVWWIALAVAAAVPVEMHWVMTNELTFPGRWYAPLGRPASRLLLRRFARVYGFTGMPPMPPRPRDAVARAEAVRRVLSHLKAHPEAILGLAPEGADMPHGALSWPPPGAGRFLLLLAEAGFKIVPAGAFEADGAFCLTFGPAYNLSLPPGLSSEEKDRAAARTVMTQIARQLPPRLRGEFASSAEE